MCGYEFFVDPSRCIGCQACVKACAECDTHRGQSDDPRRLHRSRETSIATVPTVCMHCDEPTCAQVCPADAIKKGEDGVVQSSLKPRCIACSNCVLACPFGVPKMHVRARADDEVRHVLRPHVGRACGRCAPPSARARRSPIVPPAGDRASAPRAAGQHVPVRQPDRHDEGVHDGAARATDRIAVDVVDYMWEGRPDGREPTGRSTEAALARRVLGPRGRRALRQPPPVRASSWS